MPEYEIIHGDCLEVMRTIPDNCIDSIVSDPPYGISFMGKKWDYDVPSVEVWKEVLRILKPGGHALIACGTRTQHRMAVNIEDAGFEIRDIVGWIYGSGFPKSLNIGKAIDKRGGNSVGWFGEWLRTWRGENNISQKEISKLFPSKSGGLTGCVANWELGLNLPTAEQFTLIVKEFNLPFESIEEAEREVIGKLKAPAKSIYGSGEMSKDVNITASATEQAKQWEGWGTALKPAMELWTLARKPLSEKTVAENVLKWGTGGINIDKCRIKSLTGNNPTGIINEKGNLLCQEKNIESSVKSVVGKRNPDKLQSNNSVQECVDMNGSENPIGMLPEDMNIKDILYSEKISEENINTNLSISISGKSITEKNQKDMKSIISTETKQITESKISNLCQQDNIEASINENILQENKSCKQELNNNEIVASAGRWPSNLIHDGSDEVVGLFPETKSGFRPNRINHKHNKPIYTGNSLLTSKTKYEQKQDTFNDSGSAAHFFYTAKASKAERNAGCEGMEEKRSGSMMGCIDDGNFLTGSGNPRQGRNHNHHPTVKPLALMRYLCRLITPPKGIVLDCYAGSGSTLVAAYQEGFDCLGIEREAEYVEIARNRIEKGVSNAS